MTRCSRNPLHTGCMLGQGIPEDPSSSGILLNHNLASLAGSRQVLVKKALHISELKLNRISGVVRIGGAGSTPGGLGRI